MAEIEKINASVFDRLDELPTLPTIVYELSQVINDPMSSTGDVEKIMANDQSLTTKVLKLANSAYYAIPGGVSSLQRAIAYIGYDAIHQLVLSASIIDALKVKSSGQSAQFALNEFWKHSLGVAMASETTAKFLGHRNPSDLFTCGLVHDMGKIAYFILVPDAFLELVTAANQQGATLDEVEEQRNVPRHCDVGAQLAVRWKLPMMIQACTQWHHQKDPALRRNLSADLNNMVDMVHLSNLLIHGMHFGNSGHDKALGVSKSLLDRMYLTPEKLKDLVAKTKTALASADAFLKVIGG